MLYPYPSRRLEDDSIDRTEIAGRRVGRSRNDLSSSADEWANRGALPATTRGAGVVASSGQSDAEMNGCRACTIGFINVRNGPVAPFVVSARMADDASG